MARTSEVLKTQCCIAGGGPAGMMLGYLLSRQGVDVIVIEKHADFLRDFRGDTVHPSTLQVFHELGLLDTFLRLPHQKTEHIKLTLSGQDFDMADFTRLDLAAPYIAFMPQWDLLNFLAENARVFPNFTLLQSTEAIELLDKEETVTGLKAITEKGTLEIQAELTVAADGRDSCLRQASQLPLKTLGAPIDVFWFRLPRKPDEDTDSLGAANENGFLVLINRGDYWQCALPFPKGSADVIRKQGLEAFRSRISAINPKKTLALEALQSWDDVKLLNVQVNRLEKWYRPGLICIGDAAHAMSPVGGVGINLAVQDAVAAGRLIGTALKSETLSIETLKAVQKRRETAAKVTQFLQLQAHERVLTPVLTSSEPFQTPKLVRLINKIPALQGLFARAIGMGVTPEHWP